MTSARFLLDGQPLTEEQAAEWLRANGFGQNFAGSEKLADRATDYANTVIRASDQAREVLLKPWSDVDWLMRGNPLGIDVSPTGSTHVPEVKKGVYALAPRIVEAILGAGDEVFRVRGRDRTDRARAMRIEEMLRYQLSQSRHMDGIEDRVLCGLLYGVVAVATSWDIRYGHRMVRKARHEQRDGKREVVIDSDYQRILEYEGLRTRLIDPRDLIWDPSAMCSSDAAFAGERMRVPLAELLAMEASGVLSGVAEAIEGGGDSGAKRVLLSEVERLRIDAEKRRRDGTYGDERTLLNSKRAIDASDANRVEVTALWATWSHVERPARSVDWGRWQFLWVNGVPVRIARNPYDSQHIPIAFARMNHSPFSPWGISVAMDGLPIQIEYDQMRGLGHRSHELSVTPIGVHGEGTDLPRSMKDMEPGEWLRGQPDQFTQLKFQSTISETIAASDLMRRDMREVMGVPEGFTGSDQSGTATQFEGNILEANRRARQLTFNYADLEREVLRHTFVYAQQFITERKTYAVLGRAAKRLGWSVEIRPEDLLDPVDIEIVGLQRYGSNGQRGTKMVQFQNQFGPSIIAEMQAGRWNNTAYLREAFNAMFGYSLDDQILSPDLDPEDVMTPQEENAAIIGGADLEPHPLDDDVEHAQAHVAAFDEAEKEGVSSDRLSALWRHAVKHGFAAKSKQARQAAAQRAQELAQQQPGAGAEAPRLDKEPGEGRGYQRPLDLGNGPGKTPPGVTPGPANAARMGAMDRDQAMPQGMNAS